MKRKLEFGDDNQSKLIKTNHDDHYQLNFCDLPFEIHFEILNYLDSTIDGGNYVLTCKELYRSLYSTHDLFLACRVVRDLGRLVKKVNIPTFTRATSKKEKKRLKKSGLNNFEKKLSNTVKELVGSVKQVEQTLENKVNMAKKISEWNSYLDEVEEENGKAIAKDLEEKIFNKCTIVSSSNEGITTYNAEVMIGDIKITHKAYDEGDYTSWCLRVNKGNEDEMFAEVDEREDICLNDNFDDLKERIGLNDNLSDKLVIDTIIMTLPWGNNMECVFYNNVLRE